MNEIKTIDDALAILIEAKSTYGNLPINIIIDEVTNVTVNNCLDILYDDQSVTFYNC